MSPKPPVGTREPFLIGVCGGTASGKTTVCDRIMQQLQERRVVLISQVRRTSRSPCTEFASTRGRRPPYPRAAVPRRMRAAAVVPAVFLTVRRAQDSSYRGLTPYESANVKEYNFDHPDAMDQEAILKCLVDLKNRCTVEVPIYDFVTHRRARMRRHAAPPPDAAHCSQSAGEDADGASGGRDHL